MAKRRFQNPEPKRSGNWWYLLQWTDEFSDGKLIRKRKRIKLAPASVPVREVRKIATEQLRAVNQGLETIGSATGFREYVEFTYKPTQMPLMAKTTQGRYSGIVDHYLMPTFGDALLRDLSPMVLQRYFSEMASSPLSYESRDKIRDVMSSILGSAVQFGLLVKNPVEGLRLPPDKTARRAKPHVTPEQFHRLVARIPEPYATMLFVAVHTGLRVSELIGLKWRAVGPDSIAVEARCCRGDWGQPKSKASNATIAVDHSVIERIHRLKDAVVFVKAGRATRRYRVVKSATPDDLVFQSVRAGRPMRDNNILVRFIKPAARELGMGWVNWRCLRTSYATWLKMAGADVKDAQAQMRHSRASTTLDIYMQHVPESQRAVVTRLSALSDAAVPQRLM